MNRVKGALCEIYFSDFNYFVLICQCRIIFNLQSKEGIQTLSFRVIINPKF